jgi:diguanylate cyclase (GGDEF)-like protein
VKIPFERFVYIGLGVTTLTIVLMSAAQYHAMHALVTSGLWVDHSNRVVNAATAIRGAAKTAESAARGFALTGDSAFLDDLQESVASVNQDQRELRSLTVDNPRQQQRLDKLEPLLAQRFRALADLVSMRRSSEAAAAQFVQAGAGTALAAAVESLCLGIQNEEHSLLNGRRAALEQGTNGALLAGAAVSLFSFLVLGSASALIFVEMGKRRNVETSLESANAKLTEWNEALALRNREIILLGQMGELLQACVSEAEAERILLKFAPDLFPALSGALSMIKASRNAVERTVSWGDATVSAAVFLPEDCWALRRGLAHGSGSSCGRIKCAHLEETFAGSFVCVPMMAHGETIGVLHLLDGPHLGESEMRLATMVAERMGLAIANLRLREALKAQSIRDPLTGLFNRRYMEESLERELHRADRDKSTIGVIMADLDHFKQFNDTFGHEGGDAILKEFSALLVAQTRKEDIVCRYGGEEFLIVFPGASLEDAHNRAANLLQATRKVGVVLRGQELGPVSASMGVALYPKDANTMASMIRAADDALYQAKTHGRDCVVLAAAHPVPGGPHIDGSILTATAATIGGGG